MSFFSCKNSRRCHTRPMPTESTNYLLSVNAFAKSLQVVAEGFTRTVHRVTVFSRAAILAPGGWASDREPAKRFDRRPLYGRPIEPKTLPSRNETSSLFARSSPSRCGWLAFAVIDLFSSFVLAAVE